jgi:hypothetical protein
VTQGVERAGRVPLSKMPRSRLRRGRGHPWPRSRSNGLRRRGARHGHGHRTERVVARRGPLGPPRSETPPVNATARICRAQDCCLLLGSTWGRLMAACELETPIAARVHGCGLRRPRRLVAGGRGRCRTRRSGGADIGLQLSALTGNLPYRVSVVSGAADLIAVGAAEVIASKPKPR